MKLIDYIIRNKFSLLFFVFIVFYFLCYGFYGFDDVDGGYTLALSWRIFNGEIPYRDFILVRPPLSPLLHTLPLYIIPANYQVIFERLFAYLLFGASSLLGSLTLTRVFLKEELNIHTYLLATIGFVFSVHNFPPMAWHTTDAVFFAAAGIYALAYYPSLPAIVFGIFLLFLSAMCKQPFYLMPLAGITFVATVHKNLKKTTAAAVSLILFTGLFFLALYKLHAVKNFLVYTAGSIKLKDLLLAGVINYFHISASYFLLPLGFWILTKQSVISKRLHVKGLTPYFLITILLGLPLSEFLYVWLFKEVTWSTYISDSTARIFFIITVFLLLANLSLEKKWLTLWFLISVSWCAGISWGYLTPVLFSVPLIAGFLLVSVRYCEVKKIPRLALYTLLLGSATYFVAYQKPYQNPMKRELIYRIDKVFPKLNHLKVSRETYDKYTEFASLVTKYGINFKTLPGITLSNYLTNTNSPLKIDWVLNAETNNQNAGIINDLQLKKIVVFLEKKPQLITVTDSDDKFNSSVAYFIKTNWQKIDSTKYFEIYRSQ